MHTALGLKRGTVYVVPYDPAWAVLFEEEHEAIRAIAGAYFVAMEHIGSTSIPGIHAKPIIDMQLGLTEHEGLGAFRGKLESLGYTYRENGSDGLRTLFVKGSEERRTHHLHVTTYGSLPWHVAILFRDHLRAHSDVAREYNRLKMDLAARHRGNRELYSAHKKGFIENVLTKIRGGVSVTPTKEAGT